jgi:hypothetical protein
METVDKILTLDYPFHFPIKREKINYPYSLGLCAPRCLHEPCRMPRLSPVMALVVHERLVWVCPKIGPDPRCAPINQDNGEQPAVRELVDDIACTACVNETTVHGVEYDR